jgi:hypothetical protein
MQMMFHDLDPMLLQWASPRQPPSPTCSVCDGTLEFDTPLVLWRSSDEWRVELCHDCVDRFIRVR